MKKISRKTFIEKTFKTALSIAFGSSFITFANENSNNFYAIIIDYKKCTGCRTCEITCSSYHNGLLMGNKIVPGPPFPEKSNIKVFSYNPDLFLPTVCQFCTDSPCINSCPSPVNSKTGKKALSKNPEFGNIIHDKEVCLGCGNCVRACKEKSVGILNFDEKERVPYGFCDLCGGNPQCVKHCPYNALKFIKGEIKRKYYKMKPKAIARELQKEIYDGFGGDLQ